MNLRRKTRETGPDESEGLRGKLARLRGLLSDAPGMAPHVTAELRGKREVQVRGCERILVYLPERITLLTREGEWTVAGRGLTCTAYDSGSIGIEGVIDGIYAEDALLRLSERLREHGGETE